MRDIYIVYKTTNIINNKFYIGIHKTKDINDDYYGSGVCINAAIQKYGKQNFKREILHVFSNRKDAIRKEIELVTEDLVENPMCYNVNLGGRGGFHHIRKQNKHTSCKGRRVIHNKLINKTTKVIADNLQKYLDVGWELGFLPESIEKMSAAGKLKIQHESQRKKNSETKKDSYVLEHISTGKRKFIKKAISEEYLKNGWRIFDMGKFARGKRFIYNPQTKKCITVKKEEVEQYLKEGWVKGRIPNYLEF